MHRESVLPAKLYAKGKRDASIPEPAHGSVAQRGTSARGDSRTSCRSGAHQYTTFLVSHLWSTYSNLFHQRSSSEPGDHTYQTSKSNTSHHPYACSGSI